MGIWVSDLCCVVRPPFSSREGSGFACLCVYLYLEMYLWLCGSSVRPCVETGSGNV